MGGAPTMLAVRHLAVLVAISAGCHKESPMSPPPAAAPPFTVFTPLRGGQSQAIAPGPPLVTLLASAATWWEHDAPVTAELPPNTPVAGTRWAADGKGLRVGLGTLDLATRQWHAAPTLAALGQSGPGGDTPVKRVAWFTDALHVALVLETRDPSGRRTSEVVVAALADGSVLGRYPVTAVMAMAAGQDRVLVSASNKVILLDRTAAVVAEPAGMPASVSRINENGGMFAATGATGAVALVRATDGVVVATWDVHAADAVPVPHGVVAVDDAGVVRVGCLQGNALKPVAEAPSGALGAIIQIVGERVVLAGAGADPVRVATFTNPCH